jgi:putative ABC transport system ATP-binding protein
MAWNATRAGPLRSKRHDRKTVTNLTDASLTPHTGEWDQVLALLYPDRQPMRAAMSPMISLQNVTKSYRRGHDPLTVLRSVSFEAGEGEFLALMGPSGSGKTTLLNLIGGLSRPDSGEIRIAGERVDKLSERQLTRWRARHVGFVFQFYNLLPALSAEQNVEVPLLLTKVPRRDRRRKANACLELVGLTDRAGYKPAELSGGQQQRVAIARAMVSDPTLLVCDEPTGDLDRNTAGEILELLQSLCRERCKTIVLVTHDPRAAAAAERTLQVDKGHIERSTDEPTA